MTGQVRWEYRVEVYSSAYVDELEAVLRPLGADGWELVGVLCEVLLVFKRRSQEEGKTDDRG